MDSAQGIVRVVVGAGPSASSSPFALSSPSAWPLPPDAPLTAVGVGDIGQPSTTVVVMGTLGSGISVHPQCNIVIVVVRHVSVRMGQLAGSCWQIVVYVVETSVGDSLNEKNGDTLPSESALGYTGYVVGSLLESGLSVCIPEPDPDPDGESPESLVKIGCGGGVEVLPPPGPTDIVGDGLPIVVVVVVVVGMLIALLIPASAVLLYSVNRITSPCASVICLRLKRA